MSPFDRPAAPPAHPSVTLPRRDRPASLQCVVFSRRTRWSCDLEVWAWAVGQLAPSTFPPAGTGGLAHLGSRRLPRMRYLADEITAAAATQGSKRAQACRMRATAHTLSGFSPANHDLPRVHARPSRRTCDERVWRAPSRQHHGSAAAPACADKQSVSAPTLEARRLWAALNRAAA